MSTRAKTSQVQHLNKGTKRPFGIVPGFDGGRARACEYIEGDPRAVRQGIDPHCNGPVVEFTPYCEKHLKMCGNSGAYVRSTRNLYRKPETRIR